MRTLRKNIERRLDDSLGRLRLHPDYTSPHCFSVIAEREDGATMRYEEHVDRNLRPIYERLEVIDASGKRYVFQQDREGNSVEEGGDPERILRKFFPYKRKTTEAKK